MRKNRISTCCLLLAVAACLALVNGCGGGAEKEKVIIEDPTRSVLSHPLYAEAGGLGGTVGRVNVGEYATVSDRREVGPDVPNAIPGVWVKIETLFQPREGWIPFENTRPAPAD